VAHLSGAAARLSITGGGGAGVGWCGPPVLQGFKLGDWRPKLVIVEIQEKQVGTPKVWRGGGAGGMWCIYLRMISPASHSWICCNTPTRPCVHHILPRSRSPNTCGVRPRRTILLPPLSPASCPPCATRHPTARARAGVARPVWFLLRPHCTRPHHRPAARRCNSAARRALRPHNWACVVPRCAQARYRDNERTQADAAHMETYFREAGYSILYRDVINTVFLDRRVRCVGGD
jgi:hypothetical protein